MSPLCSGAAFALALLTSASSVAVAADCFDGLRIGLFSERHYGELDKPWRDQTSDPKIDHAAKTALRGLRADVSLIRAKALDAALAQARGNELPVLAFLDVEAESSAIEMQSMVNIATTIRLQFLDSGNGSVLGESSDFDEVRGLNIEQALSDLIEVSSIATMAEEAGRKACKSGLTGSMAVAATAPPSQPAAPTHDPALVSQIQYALNDLGYDAGTPDGVFGGLTEQAIKQAQIDMRLTPDGEANEGLLAKLKGHSRQMIVETQSLLKSLDRIKGEPSGVINSETIQAIETFEVEQGLPFDGKPDPDLIRVLKAELRGGETTVDEPAPADGAADDPALRFRIETLLFELDYLENPPSAEKTLHGDEAIRAAEIDLGLTVDGLPDITLLRELTARARG